MEVLQDVPVNDGRGFMDSLGMIDSLIVDCERGMKALLAGSPLEYAAITVKMVQKLGELKKGVKNDAEGQARQIRELRELLQQEGGREDASGSVCDALDGTVGSREELLRDVIFAEGGGLEPDPDNAGS